MILRLLCILAGIYGALLLTALFFSDSMMFQPHPSSYRDSSAIIKLPVAGCGSVSALYLDNPASRYTVLFSHGNAEDLGDISFYLKELQQLGFSVMGYDYCGYGTSGGAATAGSAVASAQAAFDYLVRDRRIPPDRIILWGRSLGSGPAFHLAARYGVGGVVVESGFTSAFRVLTRIRLLPFDKFDNLEEIGRISSPLLVMHGRKDRIVPFSHGVKLYEAATVPKLHLWVDNAGHNDLAEVAGRAHPDIVREFEKLLPR